MDDGQTHENGGRLASPLRDVRAGLLVFLIALPLCLGIAVASGFPAMAGVFTAIVGGLLCTFIGGGELTIKGPAAGLIVVVLGCVEDFGGADGGYRAALAVGVVAGVGQVVLGAVGGGGLAGFCPKPVVRGMLASIGLIILIKQIPVMLGTEAAGEPAEVLRHLPEIASGVSPPIAGVGLLCLAVMFAWPALGRRIPRLRAVPAPLIVVAISLPFSFALGLDAPRNLTLLGSTYEIGPRHLVDLSPEVFGLVDAVTTPDFGSLGRPIAWKWVVMFLLIGSIESLLSARAVDLLDPRGRRTNLSRDLLAVGAGNAVSCGLGGLPMISEIVRSRANIDAGGRTRFANLWHGVFLLACVALIPAVLNRIPLAALAALLVYTGVRLASPAEFVRSWRAGVESFAAFVLTLIVVLATDLLIGVAAGAVLTVGVLLVRGVGVQNLFRARTEIVDGGARGPTLRVSGAAVVTNWPSLQDEVRRVAAEHDGTVTLDLSRVGTIDRSTRLELGSLGESFEQGGPRVDIAWPGADGPAADIGRGSEPSGEEL
ncbi:MAG: SulP family inorganic anion transporter [Planctomycetota bacterium]